MPPSCGVCHAHDSKYKCPICELKYCSIDCYKHHKPIHAADESSAVPQPAHVPRDRPGTTQRVPQLDFTRFETDPDFLRLLSRYPLLKPQLQTLYGLTLEPGPDEARTWSRTPLYGEAGATPYRGHGRGRGRGRGFSRGGRGGRGRGTFEAREGRQGGQWTQDKGDKEALMVMQRMRGGGEADERAEGLREFGELLGMKFGPERERKEEW